MPTRPTGAVRSRPVLTLIAVCVSCGLLPASLTGTSVALPDLGGDLHASLVTVQWVVNAYNLTFASVMLVAGSLADLLGRRRMFTLGLTVFVLCTAGAALVSEVVLIDVLRGAAGVGAAMVLTAATALLAQTYDGAGRARAFGFLGSSFGLGLALGPSLSGLLVGAFGWRSVFLAHAAVAVAVLLLCPLLTESRDPAAGGVDYAGAATFSGALFALTLALVEGPQLGWGHPLVPALAVLAALLLTGFVRIEKRRARPMLELSLLREPKFVAVGLMPVLLAFGFVCLLVFLPSYFIGVGGMTSQRAGLTMLLLSGPVLALPVLSGALARKAGTAVPLGVSLLLVAGGAAWLTVLDQDATTLMIAGPLLVIGTGVGISFGLLDGAAVGAVDASRAGMAAGLFNTMRLTGEAVAIAGMGSVLVSITRHNLKDPGAWRGDTGDLANRVVQGEIGAVAGQVPAADRAGFTEFVSGAYTSALHTVLWLLAAVCAVGAPVIMRMLRTAAGPEVSATADRGAKEPITMGERS
ncbi:MFS transporter [Streptomyces rubradiris]|uniref:MFS transporter n=1 Tax=Streptomyces rubradiris TaxID=285531 RepID=A0ABQ3R930_STRRR|nr:MFS transporter [Streptomyces rubradiris]GHG99296.1 MFS transporter [Streptomyces rubradiris]GHI52356.1 MFS transporter [Streptomyces rubradiris]